MKNIFIIFVLLGISVFGSLMGDVISYTSYSTPDDFPTNLYGIANYELTDVNRDVYVKKFDTNLGTLTGATLSITYHLNTTMTATNDNNEVQEIDASSDSRATWSSIPINPFEPDGTDQYTLSNYPLATGDQTYTAGQTKIWGPTYLDKTYGTPFLDYSGASLSQFEYNGLGNIIVNLVTLSSYTVYGASNSTVSQDSDCYGEITVSYTYIPTEDPVPVTLSSFTVAISQGSQLLEWTTQSEDNSLGWHVYRSNEESYDGSVRITDIIIEGAGFSSQPIDYTLYDDDNLNVGETYWYFLENLEYNNSSNIVGRTSIMIEEDEPVPVARDKFIGNYPNPFNPSTTIAYSVKESAAVKLTIYNLKGQKIIQLINENRDSGEYNQIWNGRDSKGTSVGSGIYLAKLTIGDKTMSRKMLLMK